MRERLFSTVLAERKSAPATSLLERPRATSSGIAYSRAVSPAPDPAVLARTARAVIRRRGGALVEIRDLLLDRRGDRRRELRGAARDGAPQLAQEERVAARLIGETLREH